MRYPARIAFTLWCLSMPAMVGAVESMQIGEEYPLSFIAPQVRTVCAPLIPGYAKRFDAAFPAWLARNSKQIEAGKQSLAAKLGSEHTTAEFEEMLTSRSGPGFAAAPPDEKLKRCDDVLTMVSDLRTNPVLGSKESKHAANFFGASPSDKVSSIDITIVDEQGHPIPYATIWTTYNDVRALQSGIERFADDGDLGYSSGPWFDMLVYHADQHGKFDLPLERVEFYDQDHMMFNAAAQKRGYAPIVGRVSIRVGDFADLRLELREMPADRIDPGLLEFDRLRGEVYLARDSSDSSDQRAQTMEGLVQQIRAIAQRYETAGNRQLAAKIYFALSELPSVDVAHVEGHFVVQGYTNGYDKNDPKRVADRQHALTLNVDDPNLSLWALDEELDRNGGDVIADDSKSAERRRYIAAVVPILNAHRRELWPDAGRDLMIAYRGERDSAAACRTLQAMHKANALFFEADFWSTWQGSIKFDDREHHKTPTDCPIEGLAARPDAKQDSSH